MTEQRIAVSQRAFVALIVAVFVAIGAAAAVGVATFVLFQQSQANRVEVNETICERQNAIAVGQRAFVHRVSPELDAEARAVFRIVKDCRAYAENIVAPKPAGTGK